jgi:hypothetical protein
LLHHGKILALELKRLSSWYFTDHETAIAVTTVDLEPAADKSELSALIRKETYAEHQTLRKELNGFKKQISILKKPPNATSKNHNNANTP